MLGPALETGDTGKEHVAKPPFEGFLQDLKNYLSLKKENEEKKNPTETA